MVADNLVKPVIAKGFRELSGQLAAQTDD